METTTRDPHDPFELHALRADDAHLAELVSRRLGPEQIRGRLSTSSQQPLVGRILDTLRIRLVLADGVAIARMSSEPSATVLTSDTPMRTPSPGATFALRLRGGIRGLAR